jgi:hypothetical protein
MSRIRLILLSVLAVLAVSAVASASASAASEYFICKSKAGGKFENNKCNTKMTGVEEFEFQKIIAPAREAIEGTGGVAVLEGHVDGVRAAIECKKSGFKGEIASEGAGTEEVKLEECGDLLLIANHQAPEKTTCKIENLEFSVKSQLVSGEGIGPEYEIKPANGGKVLLETELTGESCLAFNPKRFTVEVTKENEGIVCAFPEYAVGKEEHEVSCSSTGDRSLVSYGKPAIFTNIEKVKLSSGVGWYVE